MHRQYLFSHTNGITTSLSGEKNMLTVQFRFSLNELTEQELAAHLNNFVGEVAKVKILVYKDDPTLSQNSNDADQQLHPGINGSFLEI